MLSAPSEPPSLDINELKDTMGIKEAIALGIERATGVGGWLRVRSGLAIGMTVIGGIYLLDNQVMPPNEFNILWGGAMAYYFGSRSN